VGLNLVKAESIPVCQLLAKSLFLSCSLQSLHMAHKIGAHEHPLLQKAKKKKTKPTSHQFTVEMQRPWVLTQVYRQGQRDGVAF